MTARTGGLARTQPTIFGVPSLETARAIDDSDKAAGLQAAHFRLSPACVSLSNSLTPKRASWGLRSSRNAERSSAAERKPRLPQSTRYAGRHP